MRFIIVLALAVGSFACNKDSGEGGTPAVSTTSAHAQTAPESQKAPPAGKSAGDQAAPAGKVLFLWPDDGSRVFTKTAVKFGVEGRTVRPAGEDATDKTSGHHHLIIDGAAIPAGQMVPKDEKNIHYGGGQTEAEIELTPGEHTLTLQFADGAHLSYGPDWATTVKVEAVAPPAPPRVFFVEPTEGAELKSPVKLSFGLEGFAVRKAGEDVKEKISGHHHLIIDGQPDGLGAMVGKDETHIHYGGGQTEAEVALTPGKHTLTLQFADGAHRSYGAALSQTITVNVTE